MESNGLRGGVFTNLNPGILGLEMPLHHHFQPQQQQQQQPAYPSYAVVTQNQKHSDDEDGGMDDNAGADGKRKGSSSPWQRMKWTDGMVRLLIMAVYYIGDECGSDSNNNNAISSSDAAGKKKAGALMQKKGKWKSVSKAMMEKGFYVSPQQCEDKFNDLNKRYKRVNEILGKGTACRVVENQSLLDQMDHLSPKSKDEVRKLLNSKHLFFREMCAYHNSCGGGGAAAGPGHHSPDQSLAPPPPPQNLSGNRQIHHHSRINNMDEKQSEDEDSEHEDDDSEEEEDSEVRCSTKRHREENMRNVEGRTTTTTSFEMLRVLNEEVAAVMEDETKSGWEKRRWMKIRMVRVEKEMEAFEMEKERLKWIKYCGNKERDMERKRLRNERGKLECDRMLLLLKHKEMEFDISPSSVTG